MPNTVLVAGASGLVGAAAVDRFLDDGWEVVAAFAAQAEKVFSDRPFRHLAVDLQDESASKAAFAGWRTSRHVVYAAVYEKPGLIAGLDRAGPDGDQPGDAAQPDGARWRGGRRACGTSACCRAPRPTASTSTRSRCPRRERCPRDQHENFYWLQEDYVRAKAGASDGWTFTILRPQLIVGPELRRRDEPAAGDRRLRRASAGRRAGRSASPAACPTCGRRSTPGSSPNAMRVGRHRARRPAGETYNLTNGEVFEWRDLWPALAEVLGVEVGPDEPLTHGASSCRPRPTCGTASSTSTACARSRCSELLGESHHYADFCFAYGATEYPPLAFVSTVKIKQPGFTEAMDTEESFRHWIRVLQERRVLPPRD